MSLQEQVHWLKNLKSFFFFTEVGEALKQSIPKNDTDPLENIDTATEEIIEFSEVSNNVLNKSYCN